VVVISGHLGGLLKGVLEVVHTVVLWLHWWVVDIMDEEVVAF
jgi:hypothetical protein